ncbi:MAG: hypothetical protein ACI39C_07385 [Dietzia sp.]
MLELIVGHPGSAQTRSFARTIAAPQAQSSKFVFMRIYMAGLAIVAVAAGGCSQASTNDGPIRATGTDPGFVLQVDCGVDGVANVTTTYGTSGDSTNTYLVGRNPVTRGAGGIERLDTRFGTTEGLGEAPLTIVVEPTTGTCNTILTDVESGDVVAERSSAGKTTVEGIVPAMG